MLATPEAIIIYGGMALVVVVVLVTALLQYLWNTTMPEVFNLKVITFRQAFRLLLLAALLTSGGLLHFAWNR